MTNNIIPDYQGVEKAVDEQDKQTSKQFYENMKAMTERTEKEQRKWQELMGKAIESNHGDLEQEKVKAIEQAKVAAIQQVNDQFKLQGLVSDKEKQEQEQRDKSYKNLLNGLNI